jgi:hypothetical protein
MERGKVQIGSEILLRISREFGKSMECLLADSYSAASVRAHRHIGSRGGGQSRHSAQGKGIAASASDQVRPTLLCHQLNLDCD